MYKDSTYTSASSSINSVDLKGFLGPRPRGLLDHSCMNTCHKEGKKEEEKTAIMDHTYGVAVLALDEAADFFGGMVYKQTTYDSEQKLK